MLNKKFIFLENGGPGGVKMHRIAQNNRRIVRKKKLYLIHKKISETTIFQKFSFSVISHVGFSNPFHNFKVASQVEE